jgi:uncharacterized Zn-binding protein involved in type VI secretion
MGEAAATLGAVVTATDTHVVMVPTSGGPVPTPMSFEFAGRILAGCATTVLIGGQPAAVLGCVAQNLPPHVPEEGHFAEEPTNEATVTFGSDTVSIEGKPVVRNGDRAMTCNDPAPLPVGVVEATGTVLVG